MSAVNRFLYGNETPTKDVPLVPPVSYNYLRRMLDYDPETGVFRWANGKQAGFDVKTQSGTYTYIGIGGKRYTAGKLAWYYTHKQWPRRIYFLDGDGTSAKINNLNINGRILRKKLQGVSYKQKDKHWYVTIGKDGESVMLGRYKDFFEACCQRKSWENKLNYQPGVKKRHGKAKEQ